MGNVSPNEVVRSNETHETERGPRRAVILIGASTGGIEAVTRVLRGLPAGFDALIAITLHRSPSHPSLLSSILTSKTAHEVIEPRDGQLFESKRVFLAPPDRHLVFGSGAVFLSHAPRENFARPSIDVMFRSGAENFGSRVIGVILTGHLTDGVAGLTVIKKRGGLSLAQEPAEALAPSMPMNAVAYDGVDIIFHLAAAGEVLGKLVAAQGVAVAASTHGARRPRKDRPSA
jgi:two-component system chemotaxis response regulator CheB